MIGFNKAYHQFCSMQPSLNVALVPMTTSSHQLIWKVFTGSKEEIFTEAYLSAKAHDWKIRGFLFTDKDIQEWKAKHQERLNIKARKKSGTKLYRLPSLRILFEVND
jgi:hypothetical protein